ncbi:hypothetical protein GGI42DRAFT_351175 [Trichoderma sp. SZMC 28013]
MAASAPCNCICLMLLLLPLLHRRLEANTGESAWAKSNPRSPMSLQFSSPSSSAIRRGPARIRSGQVRPGQARTRTASKATMGLGRLSDAAATTACILDTLIRSSPQIVSITSRVPYRACNR